MTLTFGSLFAGIGGFDLGFERAGMKCLWQVEIDDYANRVIEKHWPHVKRWRDVRTFPQPGFERVDVICGGPPCQPISCNGRRGGASDERWLWGDALRVVRNVRPRFAVFENPPALLDFTGEFRRILGELSACGFDAEWDVIPAAAIGSDQIRERLFILAYPKHDRMEGGRGIGTATPAVLRRTRVCQLVSPGGNFQADESLARVARRETHWKDKSRIRRVAHGVPNRVHRLRGLGNAVVPQVAQWIGERIMEAVT